MSLAGRLAARGTPVKVQFWVLGFLDTGIMAAQRTPLPKGDPQVPPTGRWADWDAIAA